MFWLHFFLVLFLPNKVVSNKSHEVKAFLGCAWHCLTNAKSLCVRFHKKQENGIIVIDDPLPTPIKLNCSRVSTDNYFTLCTFTLYNSNRNDRDCFYNVNHFEPVVEIWFEKWGDWSWGKGKIGREGDRDFFFHIAYMVLHHVDQPGIT